MNKIPLFILAGCDKNDEFSRKRLLELKIKGKLILDYLLEEVKKSDCFSDVFLIGQKEFKNRSSSKCFFIEAKNHLWKNTKIIYQLTEKKYHYDTKIAVLLSDILPSADDLKDIVLKSDKLSEKDAMMIITPSDNLSKARGKFFLKKDEQSLSQSYFGTGGFYILRPMHINKKLIYRLTASRMPREVRKIEVFQNSIYIQALQSFKGILFFSWHIFKIILLSIFFLDKILLFARMFFRHQQRKLTFSEAEMFLTRILIKKRYRHQNIFSAYLAVVDDPVFVNDIDDEKDVKILEIKKPQ